MFRSYQSPVTKSSTRDPRYWTRRVGHNLGGTTRGRPTCVRTRPTPRRTRRCSRVPGPPFPRGSRERRCPRGRCRAARLRRRPTSTPPPPPAPSSSPFPFSSLPAPCWPAPPYRFLPHGGGVVPPAAPAFFFIYNWFSFPAAPPLLPPVPHLPSIPIPVCPRVPVSCVVALRRRPAHG